MAEGWYVNSVFAFLAVESWAVENVMPEVQETRLGLKVNIEVLVRAHAAERVY